MRGTLAALLTFLMVGCSHAPVVLGPLALPKPGEKAVFFGDSWTEGYSATPETGGYAYLVGQRLGVQAEIDSGHGTGYVNPGLEGGGTYKQRLTARPVDPEARLLVLQGSINDLDWGNKVQEAVLDTIGLARARFPNARIVVFAPLPYTEGNIQREHALTDQVVHAAKQAGVYAVDPTPWATPDYFNNVLDPVTGHPSTQGHVFIANKLLEALSTLTQHA